jgi:hypothetical protein
LLISACTSAAPSGDVRSPSHDYPPPPRTTADGEVIGADRKPVTDAAGNPQPPAEQREKR